MGNRQHEWVTPGHAMAFLGPAFAGCLVLGVLAGCGKDTPDGTLTQDQVSDSAKVEKRDHIANQVTCQGIDEAEDRIMDARDLNKKPPAVVFDLTRDHKDHEWVDNSVWRLSDPERTIGLVSQGIDACVKQYPEDYQRVDPIDGYPDAVGYAAEEGEPPVFTRRILVPLEDRVVVVGARRERSADFTVKPDDLLDEAVAAARKSPGSTGSGGY
jgi:hypothetical protein